MLKQEGFIHSHLIVARIQNNRLVIAELQLKHTELLFNRQQTVHFWAVGRGRPWNGHDPSRLPFLYSLSPSFGSAQCKMQMGISSRSIREGGMSGHNQNRAFTYSSKWALTEFWSTVASYITTGFIAHVFPKIQPVIIRGMYVYNIYEPLISS